VERYQYDVFGRLSRFDSLNNPLAGSITGNRYGFTGQEFDSATNSYRFYYRNYSPETGLFNQRDLIEYQDGMGMYQYVKNNPANGIDIWGLDCLVPAIPMIDIRTEIKETIRLENDLRKTPDIPILPHDDLVRNLGNLSNAQSTEEALMYYGDYLKNTSQVALGSATTKSVFSGNFASAGLAMAGNATISTIDGVSAEVLGHHLDPAHHVDRAADIKSNLKRIRDGYNKRNEEEFEQHERYIEKFEELWGDDREHWPEAALEIWEVHERVLKQRRKNGWEPKEKCPPEGGTKKKPRFRYNPETGEMEPVEPVDPNEIIGPEGQPHKKWVSVKDRMGYTILCENDKSATAPARYIRISTPIEPKQDPSSFQLGGFGFNNQEFNVPSGLSSYYQRLDCRDSMDLYVDVVAGYDQLRNEAFWEFQSIDPVTLLPTDNPEKGLLFMQDSTQPNYGHGFVNFSIKPRANSVTGDTIGARAKIVFDSNDTIPTNIYTNTIDAVAPVSQMNDLPDFTPDTEIPISFSGADDAGGVGLKWYSIYVSDNDGPPQLIVADFTRTDTSFRGVADHKYKFYLSATDSVGNTEVLQLMDSVRVTSGEKVICPDGNVTFDSKTSGSLYQWQVNNGTGWTNINEGGMYSGSSTAILSLTSAPTNMYGFQYRCLVDGNATNELFLLKFGMTWEGTEDSQWENPVNWSCNKLPDSNTDVIISAGKAHYPQVSSNVTIRSLIMNPGASGTVNSGFTLTIVK
jgi:RHS repeat-associated protein